MEDKAAVDKLAYAFDLGGYARPRAGASPTAQRWLERGLVWLYGYNHEEAVQCFRRALEAEGDCVLACWGIAYAIGPYYNRPWQSYRDDEKAECLETANSMLNKAVAMTRVAAVEAALIWALRQRYPKSVVDDFQPFQVAFALAMRDVYTAFTDDLDVVCIYTEAMLNCSPWRLWDLPTGLPAEGAFTLEAKSVLEKALEREEAWQHPGLLHFYIHLMEMSPHPERALRHCDCLYTLVPDSAHLLHMPSHIDLLCGDYQSAIARNACAILADRKFVRLADVVGAQYVYYQCHNLHFTIYAAMFLAQESTARVAADEMCALITPELLAREADFIEAFVPMKLHVLVRFGRWEEILAQEVPTEATLYSVTTAMMRYARGIALANLQRIDEARDEVQRFHTALEAVPTSRYLFNNACVDILRIAEQMLLGEFSYHAGLVDEGLAHLHKAVALDDGLLYFEPWSWMQPVRHALGALLLEQGRFVEAEKVYRDDLGLTRTLSRACQHPRNVWSLHGLHECLKQRGDTTELPYIEMQLHQALARSERPIHASCYCRNKDTQACWNSE